MAELVILFGAIGTAFGIVVAVLTVREKLWPSSLPPHPLAAGIADIAAAIRERAPDLQLVLPDVPPGAGPDPGRVP